MPRALIFFLLLTFSLSPYSFSKDYQIEQQRELLMCFETDHRCACCDVLFGDCRKGSIFTIEGSCQQINAYIYDMRHSIKQEESESDPD